LGGAWNRYRGDHFGKVIWAQYASTGTNDRNWYYNEGDKRDFNLYLKASYNFNKILNVFADMQYRGVDYKMSGTLDNLRTLDQHHHFNFFNPKAGVYLSVTKRNELYCSFGIANREPSRNNYKDADPGKTPTNETLFDTEIGYAFKSQPVSFTANIYHMNYRNQLVLTGEINNVGEAVMVNVPSSYRMGIELSAVADLIKDKLQWSVTTTLSRNRIRDFVQYIDLYDPDWNYLGQQKIEAGETDLSFSPAFTASGILTAKPLKGFSVALNSKYVGKQYIDNTSSTDRMLNGYFVHGLNLSWSIETKLVREIAFNVTINNLFSYKYESNAWVYPYLIGNQYYEYNGYFPQALINFLAGITVRL
jgi:iron complex outermembrane receptor protein